jgi:DNA polymerase/3'-5' exonuclease PolX
MSTTYRLNEPFIEILDQLSNIMLKHGEPFRSRAYQKAQEVIISYPTDITSSDMLKGKPNIFPMTNAIVDVISPMKGTLSTVFPKLCVPLDIKPPALDKLLTL